MARSIQIASVFSSIGFKVDKRDLDSLQKQLTNLKRQIQSIQQIGQLKIETNLSELASAKKELVAINAELSKIKAKSINVKVNRGGSFGGGGGGGGSRFGSSAAGALVGQQLGQFTAGVGGVGAVVFGGASIFQATAQLDGLNSALLAVSGGAKEGAAQFKFLEETTERLGIEFLPAAQAFKGILAAGVSTGFGLDKSQKLFTAVASAARVLGLSADDTAGSLRAVQQMLQKGKISAEELRQQLAERLPFGMAAMEKAVARLLGKQKLQLGELDKLLEQGKLISAEVLPLWAEETQKLAEANGGLAKAMKGPLANLSRMRNAFLFFQEAIGKSEFVSELSLLFQSLTIAMKESEDGTSDIGEALAILVQTVNALVTILKDMPTELLIAAALLTPFGRVLFAVGVIILAVEDLIVGFRGGDSAIFKWVDALEGVDLALAKTAAIFAGLLTTALLIRKAMLFNAAVAAGTSIAAPLAVVAAPVLARAGAALAVANPIAGGILLATGVGLLIAKAASNFDADFADTITDADIGLATFLEANKPNLSGALSDTNLQEAQLKAFAGDQKLDFNITLTAPEGFDAAIDQN